MEVVRETFLPASSETLIDGRSIFFFLFLSFRELLGSRYLYGLRCIPLSGFGIGGAPFTLAAAGWQWD